jgi:hypothetical protein
MKVRTASEKQTERIYVRDRARLESTRRERIIRQYRSIHHLLLCTLTAGILLLVSQSVDAWSGRARARIAELALAQLPSPYREQIELHQTDLLEGAAKESASTEVNCSEVRAKAAADIQTLMLVPHEEANISNYFVYRLGLASRAVAECALPLFCPENRGDRTIRKKFEDDIDRDIDLFAVQDISPVRISYPKNYLDTILRKSRLADNLVRHAYTYGGGYEACRNETLMPSLKLAVEAVATIWISIISKESAPLAVPSQYYMNQIRYSSSKEYLEDIHAALKILEREQRRIPLTPNTVGNDFFNLPCNTQTQAIYELAKQIDPQSTVVSNRERACNEYVAQNIARLDKKPIPKREISRSLYGKEGKAPDIFVYQHESGLLLLTSKVKEVGSDYVLLNYQPVRRVLNRKVRRKIRNQPQTEEIDLEQIIQYYADDYNVSPALVKAIIKIESDFDPYAVSSAGARGLMQLMPSTALEMQVEDIFDPEENVEGGVQYFARMLELFNGDERLALAAYNAGPGNVLRYGGIPPFRETKRYVPKVLNYYEQYKRNPSPVRLRVALNNKPAADYLPEVEVVAEVEEEIVSSPLAPEAPSGDRVIIKLKNGNTMRGDAYEKTPEGIRLKILERGWWTIPEALISEIT